MSGSQVYQQTNDNDPNRRNVFSDDVAAVFEERVKIIGKILQRQSNRDLPRTFFSQGVLPSKYKLKKDSKKMAAHEHSGVLINCLMMLCSTGFTHFVLDKKMTYFRQGSWIGLLEKILLLENVMKCESMTVQQVNLIENYLPLLMEKIKRICKRKSSAKWKIIKFHLLTHLTDDIKRNGVPENVSTGPCESHHKILAKNPAKNTQRISNVFHEQVGKQYANNMLLNIYCRSQKSKTYSKTLFPTPIFSGQNFNFIYNDKENYYFADKQGIKKHIFADIVTENDCLAYLAEIADAHNLRTIHCYTVCRYNDWMVRANPCFRLEPWQDWIYYKTKDNNMLPVHLQLFVQIQDIKQTWMQKYEMENKYKRKDNFLSFIQSTSNIYGLAHFLPNPLHEASTVPEWGDNQKAHQESLIIYYSRKRTNDPDKLKSNPSMQLVSMERMFDTCIAAPDIDAFDPSVPNLRHHCYIFLKNRSEWNYLFFNDIERELNLEGDDGADEAKSVDTTKKKKKEVMTKML